MADDMTVRGPQDARHVNVNDAHELRYWTDRFSVSTDRLRASVERVGTDVDAVARDLET